MDYASMFGMVLSLFSSGGKNSKGSQEQLMSRAETSGGRINSYLSSSSQQNILGGTNLGTGGLALIAVAFLIGIYLLFRK